MSTLLPRFAASLLLLTGVSGFAHAQVATPPEATAPSAPSDSVPPSDEDEDDEGASTDPCASQPGNADGSSTSQLSDCGGVLTPPDNGTGAERDAPAPDADPGTTPVLPPGVVPDQAPNGNDSGSGTSGG